MTTRGRKSGTGAGFRSAVEEVDALRDAWRPGLRALRGAHRTLLDATEASLTGSIDLDTALARQLPNDSRWDYGVGLEQSDASERVVWMEVHPAHTSNVLEVLRKLTWLKSWLRSNAGALDALPARFVWIASRGNHVRPVGREARLLSSSGIVGPVNRYRVD
jgi:hypothetical protein